MRRGSKNSSKVLGVRIVKVEGGHYQSRREMNQGVFVGGVPSVSRGGLEAVR